MVVPCGAPSHRSQADRGLDSGQSSCHPTVGWTNEAAPRLIQRIVCYAHAVESAANAIDTAAQAIARALSAVTDIGVELLNLLVIAVVAWALIHRFG